VFRQILLTQWKWSGLGVVVACVAAFALPILTVQQADVADPTWLDARALLPALEYWSRAYPLLALAIGLLLGTTAWSRDHRNQHVYALTLPLPRWHYVLLRYGAGLALLVAPIVLLWIGSILAAALVTVPPGLRAYPHALGLRFALAVVLSYSLIFAISAGTARTAGYVLSVVGVLLVGQLLFSIAGGEANLVERVFDRMITWPGPFDIFVGRWMLIDV
jgi:ABC-type transport system involved in multi-copper enzyme maturation permease subunit